MTERDVIEQLIRETSDSDPLIRKAAAKALGDYKIVHAVEALLLLLGDVNAKVRLSAISAIGAIGDIKAIPYLTRILFNEKEKDPFRSEAVTALSNLKHDDAIDALAYALADDTLGTVAEQELRRIDMFRFVTKNAKNISKAAKYIEVISKGESIGLLSLALHKYGYKEMAEDFLNCGNEMLRRVAEKWAKMPRMAGIFRTKTHVIINSTERVPRVLWASNRTGNLTTG
jgi:hypothetical protein